MAEITKITIGLEGDTNTFKEIENASRRTTESIERDNKKVRSSYEQVIQQLIILSSLPILLSKNSSTFGENVVKAVEKSSVALKQINEDVITLYDQLIRDLIIRINTIPIALQNEKTKDVLNDLRDKAEFVLGLYRQTEPFIKMYNRNPELTKFLVLADLTFILATIGAISAAIAGLPVEATAVLFLALAASIFIAIGGTEQLNKLIESLFENANNGTQEFKEGVDGVGEALKKLEPFKNGLFSDNENFGAVFGPGDVQDVSLRFQISDLDPNKFISSDFESIAQNVATYLASGAESLTTIRTELNDIEIPEDLTLFGISPSTSKLGQIFNARTADERKNTARELTERINQETSLGEELERTNKAIDDQTKLFPPLSNALAMAGGEASAFTIGQGLMTDAFNGSTISAIKLAEKGINPLTGKANELGMSLEDLFKNTSDGAVIFGFTKEELLGLRDATDEATKSTENLGENGFTAVKENAEQAEGTFNTYGISLGNVNDLNKVFGVTQDQVNQSLDDGSLAFDNVGASAEEFGDTIEEVQNKGGFFEGIKQGFIDFVENVQSNSELMADFFADTLSQMSQNFSDLFFNVLTGKFDDLADLAKQAFEAILRAFLDLVAAIVTKQIVISVAGVLGIGKGAQAAAGGGNPADIAQQGAGVVGSGGAFETLGDEEIEYRLAA